MALLVPLPCCCRYCSLPVRESCAKGGELLAAAPRKRSRRSESEALSPVIPHSTPTSNAWELATLFDISDTSKHSTWSSHSHVRRQSLLCRWEVEHGSVVYHTDPDAANTIVATVSAVASGTATVAALHSSSLVAAAAALVQRQIFCVAACRCGRHISTCDTSDADTIYRFCASVYP